jgi:hypothetical protein
LLSLSNDGGRSPGWVVSRNSFQLGRRTRGEAAATADYMCGRGTGPWAYCRRDREQMQVCHMVSGKAQ